MKRKSLAALFMAAVVFASCSKEEEKSPEITLEKDSVTLTSGDEFLINATSDYDLTYKSEDEYHAKVDEKGLVTATYVGETNIVVSNTETSKKVKITVRPEYTLCEDLCPYLGMTKSQILSKFGEPYQTTEKYIRYKDYTSYVSLLVFTIENGVVTNITIAVSTSYMSMLISYLKERYAFVSMQNDIYMYVNNTDETKITTMLGMMVYDAQYLAVTYTKY